MVAASSNETLLGSCVVHVVSRRVGLGEKAMGRGDVPWRYKRQWRARILGTWTGHVQNHQYKPYK